jgi:small subunit ribosomal protein S13
MVRIVGVNLPDDKRVEYALTLIYGIGWASAKEILKKTNIGQDKKVKELTEQQIKDTQRIIEKNYKVEGSLKEIISGNIKRLKDIGSYRGVRHIRNLPVRGQRTRSNARTKRGKRKTVGALKKEDQTKLERQQSLTKE